MTSIKLVTSKNQTVRAKHLLRTALSSIGCASVLLGAMALQTANAVEFECTSQGEARFIRLELPGKEHLCEVSVTNSEERRVMWYANHDSLFCSDKIVELTNKYTEQWGYICEQWPDHDGVVKLSLRQRTILDAELKFLMAAGEKSDEPFIVNGVKAAANQSTNVSASVEIEGEDNAVKVHTPSTLVVQFFLSAPDGSEARDQTHVITDDGVSWNTRAKLDVLASKVEALEGYTVNSALVDSVTDVGAIEIATQIEKVGAIGVASTCYGSQVLSSAGSGQLVPRTPHRYVCSGAGRLAGNGVLDN